MIPDINSAVNKMAANIREAAILAVLAENAIRGDAKDDISEAKAYDKYGKAWIRDRVERGQLHFSRIGCGSKSKKNYSVFEIETLRRSEKHIEEMFNIAMLQTENK